MRSDHTRVAHAGEPTARRSAPPPGVVRAGRLRLHWELFGCAISGHALVGTDVAADARGDHHLVREGSDGRRWHRCLRCDAWVAVPTPAAPTRRSFPTPDEIAIPLRGRALRDRYVLRLIALERLLHVVLFTVVGVVILILAANRDALDADFQRFVGGLRGGSEATDGSGLIAEFRKFMTFSYTSMYLLAAVAFAYALLESVEAVGLWLGKRWAEYITFAVTIAFIPFEIVDLTRRVTVLTLIALVLNVAIAVYLLVAKRLFGIRGGHAAILAEYARDSGWDAVRRATPPEADGAPT